MNQEQIITQLLNSLHVEEKTKILYQYVCDKPENFQTVLGIFIRSSKTEEEIQETIISKQSKPFTLSDLQTDSEVEEGEIRDGSVFPPGTVTLRHFTDLDLQRLNQLGSTERRREISKLNLNDRDHDSLVNKLWRLRNPDRVRRNSRRAYQKRRRLSNDNNLTHAEMMV
jgi:hypothetical protein